jgi:predicted secreted protein
MEYSVAHIGNNNHFPGERHFNCKMKLKYILYVCFIAVITLAGLSACQPGTETKTVTISGPTTTVTITTGISWLDLPIHHFHYTDNKTITVDVGEEFAIALYTALMAEGFWSATYDENMLDLLANKYLDHATAIKSRAGDQYFIFKALKQGDTEITFTLNESVNTLQIEIQ